jgi:Toastrack DUF4097
MTRSPRGLAPGLIALLVASTLGMGACNLQISSGVEAREPWKKSYTLAPGGTFELHNTNGKIEIQAGDGDAVEVSADRIAKAGTEEEAKRAAAGIEIAETVTPDRILLDSADRSGSFMFNLSKRVDYTVRLPRSAKVTLKTTNGDVQVRDLGGFFRATATNGQIDARHLENSASVDTTNGRVTLEFASIGEDDITAETTNGTISVTVPHDLNARVSLRVTNGSISTDGLTMNVSEQTRRRLDATVGRGGPTIRLETTNGTVRLRGQ